MNVNKTLETLDEKLTKLFAYLIANDINKLK